MVVPPLNLPPIQCYAHRDLKPDNILIRSEGKGTVTQRNRIRSHFADRVNAYFVQNNFQDPRVQVGLIFKNY